MSHPDFSGLRFRLLEGGLAPRFVERTVLELKDHYVDAEADALNAGCSAEEAAARARDALGSESAIAASALARPELMGFAHRWPRCARGLRAFAWYCVLPAVPVVYCAQRGDSIARWGASVSLAILATAVLLFGMQSVLAGF